MLKAVCINDSFIIQLQDRNCIVLSWLLSADFFFNARAFVDSAFQFTNTEWIWLYFSCSQHESALSLCKQSFQETPNPSVFPSVHSSPRALLTFTSDVFTKWLALNCPVEKVGCVFPSPAPLFTTKVVDQEETNIFTEETPAKEESEYGKEGERGKRWLTHIPTNWAMGLCDSPFYVLCILCCLRILLDVMLKELGWLPSFILNVTLRDLG